MVELLYHFSENPGIERFEPHVARTAQIEGAYVWAIDGAHEQFYWYPRACPRVAFWPGRNTPQDARAWYESQTSSPRVHAFEARWLERVRTTTLYRYTFPADGFEPIDRNAGHWLSRDAVTPLLVEPFADLLDRHAASGEELRLVDSFWPLWDHVVASGLSFSGTKLSHARR